MSKQQQNITTVKVFSGNTLDVYQNLFNTIRQEITKTQNELQKQKAICYWKIGRHIAKHQLNFEGKSVYNQRLYARLGHDLKIDERTLQQTVIFHKSFPILTARSQLNWTNYRELLKISDQNLRDILFNKVKDERVTTRELQSQIKHIQQAKRRSDVTLENKQGTLYTYLTATQAFIKSTKGRSVVDGGFGLLRELPSRNIPRPGLGIVVESRLDEWQSCSG